MEIIDLTDDSNEASLAPVTSKTRSYNQHSAGNSLPSRPRSSISAIFEAQNNHKNGIPSKVTSAVSERPSSASRIEVVVPARSADHRYLSPSSASASVSSFKKRPHSGSSGSERQHRRLRVDSEDSENALPATYDDVFRVPPYGHPERLCRYPRAKDKVDRSSVELRFKKASKKPQREEFDPKATLAEYTYADLLRTLDGPPVTFHNDFDDTTPDQKFMFVNDYVYHQDIEHVDPNFITGCYCDGMCSPKTCDCLHDENNDDDGDDDSDELGQLGDYGRSIRKPILTYEGRDGLCLLRRDFLVRTEPSSIQECNPFCSCQGVRCWNHVVQKGRKVPLEIFKTAERGFGLRCPQPLKQGQFIEKYLGELITDKEANRREEARSTNSPSYLFTLDFFEDSFSDVSNPDTAPYVIDGEYKGSITRFMNHSCQPNCKLIPVSYHSAARRIHYLAFFAVRDLEPYTELTFDYNPKFEVNSSPVKSAHGKKSNVDDSEPVRCLCGEPGCRGQLWPNQRKDTRNTSNRSWVLTPQEWSFRSTRNATSDDEARYATTFRNRGRPAGSGIFKPKPKPKPKPLGDGQSRRGRPVGSKLIDGKLFLKGEWEHLV